MEWPGRRRRRGLKHADAKQGKKMNLKRPWILLGLSAPAVFALEPVGDPGWSGQFNLGAAGGQVESNLLAEIGGFGIDLGHEDLTDFGSPGSEDIIMPVADIEFGYTFGNGQTRISLANDNSDLVNFDRSSAILIQHDSASWGSVEAGLFSASAVETRVWENPYQLDGDRDDTELAVTGVRVVWDSVLDSGLQIRASLRERDLDEERSGQGSELNESERASLDRNGDIAQLELSYLFNVGTGHQLRPGIRVIDRDLDGDAMAQDGVSLGLVHQYAGNGVIWQGELSYAQLDADATNPVFDKKNDMDRVIFIGALLFPGAFGWEKWIPNLSVAYSYEDSDISFYDAKVWMISAALMRRF